MMIFSHGLIPHNHFDTDSCESDGYIHNYHSNGHSPEYRELCKDFESCGISNLLFQKFGSDENPLIPENSASPDPYIDVETYFISRYQEIPSGIHACSILLRAPPLA